MTEATWGGEATTPKIDWRMSAALENVPRGDADVAEVTSLERAVRAWLELDADHRDKAVLTPEHAILIDGATHATFSADGIAGLAEHLPGA
jgi:hypothetical protein